MAIKQVFQQICQVTTAAVTFLHTALWPQSFKVKILRQPDDFSLKMDISQLAHFKVARQQSSDRTTAL